MMTAEVEYLLRNHLVFKFDEAGDFISLHVNGVDKSSDGDAIDNALAVVFEAGHNIQSDMSVAMDNARIYHVDGCRLRKGVIELGLERKSEGA